MFVLQNSIFMQYLSQCTHKCTENCKSAQSANNHGVGGEGSQDRNLRFHEPGGS